MAQAPRKPQPAETVIIDALTMQRIERRLEAFEAMVTGKLGQLEDAIGWTKHDEHGQLIGVGIAGDVGRLGARMNKRFALYDKITQYAAGMTAATILFGGVIWYLVEHRIEGILR